MKETRDFADKAERFLRTAENAFKSGDYDSCVSRCYYAMFFMAEADVRRQIASYSVLGKV